MIEKGGMLSRAACKCPGGPQYTEGTPPVWSIVFPASIGAAACCIVSRRLVDGFGALTALAQPGSKMCLHMPCWQQAAATLPMSCKFFSMSSERPVPATCFHVLYMLL